MASLAMAERAAAVLRAERRPGIHSVNTLQTGTGFVVVVRLVEPARVPRSVLGVPVVVQPQAGSRWRAQAFPQAGLGAPAPSATLSVSASTSGSAQKVADAVLTSAATGGDPKDAAVRTAANEGAAAATSAISSAVASSGGSAQTSSAAAAGVTAAAGGLEKLITNPKGFTKKDGVETTAQIAAAAGAAGCAASVYAAPAAPLCALASYLTTKLIAGPVADWFGGAKKKKRRRLKYESQSREAAERGLLVMAEVQDGLLDIQELLDQSFAEQARQARRGKTYTVYFSSLGKLRTHSLTPQYIAADGAPMPWMGGCTVDPANRELVSCPQLPEQVENAWGIQGAQAAEPAKYPNNFTSQSIAAARDFVAALPPRVTATYAGTELALSPKTLFTVMPTADWFAGRGGVALRVETLLLWAYEQEPHLRAGCRIDEKKLLESLVGWVTGVHNEAWERVCQDVAIRVLERVAAMLKALVQVVGAAIAQLTASYSAKSATLIKAEIERYSRNAQWMHTAKAAQSAAEAEHARIMAQRTTAATGVAAVGGFAAGWWLLALL